MKLSIAIFVYLLASSFLLIEAALDTATKKESLILMSVIYEGEIDKYPHETREIYGGDLSAYPYSSMPEVTQEKYKKILTLIEAKADPNITDVQIFKEHKGYTPLHELVWSDYPTLVKALLDAKANPNIRTKEGETPLHRLITATSNIITLRPTEQQLTNKAVMFDYLLQAGADYDISSGYQSPLAFFLLNYLDMKPQFCLPFVKRGVPLKSFRLPRPKPQKLVLAEQEYEQSFFTHLNFVIPITSLVHIVLAYLDINQPSTSVALKG